MKIILLEDFDYIVNDRKYCKDEILKVIEFKKIKHNYAYCYIRKDGTRTIDWIPKEITKIIEE